MLSHNYHILFVIFVVEFVTSINYDEMEPVIEIELNDDTYVEEDVKRVAMKYVEENYKEIEGKIKGLQMGKNTKRMSFILDNKYFLLLRWSFVSL